MHRTNSRVKVFGFEDEGVVLWVQGFGLRVEDEFRVQGFGFKV